MRPKLFTLVCIALAGLMQEEGLRDLAQAREFHIGAAVAMKPFKNDDQYKSIVAREFNVIVAENCFKFDAIHPERDRYDFSDADALVEFASANNMKVRGHTLIWHNQLPAWVKEGNFTRNEAIALLTSHIETVMGRYRGKIWAWDVVNEAIERNKDPKFIRQESFWYKAIGPEYISMAFEIARKTDPDALLYYNDFNNEGMDEKADAVYRLAGSLSQRKLIDGVGWQMHVSNLFKIRKEHRENIRRLGELGLEVSITELDVRMKLPATPDALAKQTSTYGDLTRFCLSEPNCNSLVLWGFTDKYSWVPETFDGEGDALVFDANYAPKPAYAAIRDTLRQSVNARPQVTAAEIVGDDLVVRGSGFDKKAILFVNWRAQKTSPANVPDGSGLVVKGGARVLATPNRIQVQNSDGKLSPEYKR